MEKLELQSACFENIKTLCVNYRKDSASRKTAEHLKKRLSSLENQWQDFESRHMQLMLELEDKDTAYFKDDIFGKTKEMFLSTKTDITNKLATLGKQNIKFDLGGTSEDDDNNNIQFLLNKQECNFNAIYRVISKIDVVTTSERWELEDHFTTLKSKWDPIDKLHWEIDFQLKGSNEHYYQMFTDIEKKYDELKRKINAKIWSTVHYQKSTPQIEIPEFSGNYCQWISFKDLFLEAIHKNPMINNVQKMQHLKTKLRGEAERLVQHLTISTENYNSCWDILNQRYDNRRLQFTSFMNNMLNLPIIQNADSYNLKKMHDVITECLNGISNIGIDTSNWDPIIVHIMSQKLDSNTFSDYMKELQDHRELQNLRDFLYFLETRFMAYETMKSAKKANTAAPEKSSNGKIFNKQTQMKKQYYNFNQNKTNNYHALHGKCPFCNGSHVLRQCDKFLRMDFGKRNDTVSKLQLCKNCLFSHGNNECKSTKTCKECNLKHNTLLHNSDKQNIPSTTGKNNIEQRSSSSTQQPTSNHLYKDNMEVLLTTVQLKVKSIDGTYVTLRALLDQGSQVNLITENAAQILRLPRNGINASVSGIGSVSRECRGKLKFTCQSIHSDYSFETQALIMTKLTNNLPTRTFEKGTWSHLENLKLADPDFNVSRPIDLLLGADVYSEIILEGVLKGNNSSPVAQHTQIGWILCGKMKQTFGCHATLFDLEDLTKFWENEEIQNTKDIPKDDQCEQFYKETVRRSADGKYIVKMPLFPDYEEKLGKSRKIAVSQFLQLEKRLENNEKLSSMYKQFMEEYADLGHMKPACQISTDIYFLPHHGVLRENSTTTKLRVVFNASQRTTSGVSLNNVMEKGVNLQKDIQALIFKWRTYKYAFTADIEKMYRCTWISKEQQHLQRIVWRDSRENYFLFEAHIPLVANEDFDIYNAIPLPVRIAKETTYVHLSNKYIAVNFKKNVYMSMSEDDLKHCTQQKSQNLLCKKNLPSFNLHSKDAPCEAKLLSHRNSRPCDVERASCKDSWIELQTQNSWLAICCETCSLRIICNNDVTSQTISSSSIVTLPQGCVLQSTDLTIYAQRQYKDHMKMDYGFTAPTVDTSINKIVNLTYHYAPNILQSKGTNQEIQTIEEKIVTQRKNEASPPTMTSHDIHQYAVSYSLLTAAIIVALVVVGRNRCPNRCTKHANNKTASQPPEEIELQVIKKPECQEETGAAQTTKDLRVEPRSGSRNIAFQFD